MTELEALEAIAAFTSNGISAFTIYYSFTFAYLTACYLVASKLSKFQATAVSLLYVASAAIAAFTVFGSQQTIWEIMNTYPTVMDRNKLWDFQVWSGVTGFVFAAGIVLSLYFMYDCRRDQVEN
ncbi:MAG: hypothetical protein ACI9BW_000809 [Gammaproteobacteria bacterium]|jgi:hypothetical protein